MSHNCPWIGHLHGKASTTCFVPLARCLCAPAITDALASSHTSTERARARDLQPSVLESDACCEPAAGTRPLPRLPAGGSSAQGGRQRAAGARLARARADCPPPGLLRRSAAAAGVSRHEGSRPAEGAGGWGPAGAAARPAEVQLCVSPAFANSSAMLSAFPINTTLLAAPPGITCRRV